MHDKNNAILKTYKGAYFKRISILLETSGFNEAYTGAHNLRNDTED